MAYTLVITNHGPSDAVDVVVTDTLPAGVTVESGDACFSDIGGNQLVCTLSRLAAGDSTTLSIVVAVPADASGPLSNAVAVSSAATDPVAGNNSDSEGTAVVSRTDLSIQKTATETATGGELITYTLMVMNAGPSTAQSVVVTDTLPTGVTFVSATPGQDSGPNPLIWNVGVLDPGDTRTFTVTVRANADVPNGAVLRNRAAVDSDTVDPAPSNNEDEATTQVFGQADLEITKQASSDPVTAGDTLTYTIQVHNAGPSIASDVDVKETLPAGVTLEQLQTSQGACAGSICQLGDVPVSTTVFITAVTRLDSDLPAGTDLTNAASVFSDTPDPNDGNNTDEDTVSVEREADLALTKLASDSEVVPGQQLVFTLVITNEGPSEATNVIVTDTLPADLTFESDTDACSDVIGTLVCDLDTIPAGTSVSFNIVTRVKDDSTGTLENTAWVQSDQQPDPDPSNDEDTVSVIVVGGPSIEPQKRDRLFDDVDGDGVVSPGDTLLYEVVIPNNGNAAATGVTFSDPLDPNTTLIVGLVQTSQGTVISGNGAGDTTVEVNVGTIAAGTSVDISYQVAINDPLPPGVDSISNQGVVQGDNFPTTPTDDPDTPGGGDATTTPLEELPTAARLRNFTASPSGGDVAVRWETIAEIDNLGFNVWRGLQPEGDLQRANNLLIPSRAMGTGGASYEFVDREVPAGTWYYKLETINSAGRTDGWYGPASASVGEERGGWTIYLPLLGR